MESGSQDPKPQTEGAEESEETPPGSGKSDREEGGPTSPSEQTEETSAGEAHGTRESGLDPHE